jgi:hypothetical protein
MATSQLAIVNRALLSIGAQAQVSSINPSDGSTEGDAASVLFQPTFEMLGRAAQWNCLCKQASLSLFKAAQGTPENPNGTTLPLPPTPWLYSYLYPSDCLRLRSIVPFLPPETAGSGTPMMTINNNAPTTIPNDGAIKFAVAYDVDAQNNPIVVILTNQTQAQAIYTVNQSNPTIWDSMLQEAMVSSLAAFLVPALSLNIQLLSASTTRADKIIAEARTADSNESVTVMDHTPDWILARASNWANNGYDGWFWPPYVDMAWPEAIGE